jgi:hypothetical protein
MIAAFSSSSDNLRYVIPARFTSFSPRLLGHPVFNFFFFFFLLIPSFIIMNCTVSFLPARWFTVLQFGIPYKVSINFVVDLECVFRNSLPFVGSVDFVHPEPLRTW